MTAPALPIPFALQSRRITKPGVYQITADEYHADPVPGGSLSSSGARKLLPPSCPALFDYERRHPLPPKPVFDFGSAAHELALGAGAGIVVVDADDWRTNAAKEQRDAAHAEGKTPILVKDYVVVAAMAAALKVHPIASALLDAKRGKPEQALIWQDKNTGVWCRALVDFLRDPVAGQRIVATEYKSARNASPEGIARAVWDYGYHQRAAWYLRGIRTLLGDAALVFIFQEKTPPYLVTCAELTAIALRHGDDLNKQALEIYARCTEAGRWPGYSDEIEPVSLPGWVEAAYLKETW